MKIIRDEKEINITLPILAQAKYLECKSSDYGWIENEKFVLPFFIDHRSIFARMIFTYALIVKDENYVTEDEQQFLDDMVELLKKENICDFIYKAQSNVIFNVCPKESDCVEWGTYKTNIQRDEEELLKSFHVKHRNVVRKAKKDGVEISQTKDIQLVWEIIADTMKRQQVIHYPSLKYLILLCDALPNNVLLFIAKKDDVIQGSAVILYDNDSAYYMYGGSINRPYTGSLNLLHYEAMLFLKAKGVKHYDFVGARINLEKGSKYEGLDRFKKRFGTTLEKGYAFRVIINPWKYMLFNFAVKVYGKIKGYKYVDPIDSIGIIKK